MTKEKTCRRCGDPFVGRFCRPCQAKSNAAWRAANKEKIKEGNAAYHIANLDKIRARKAEYRAQNIDGIRARDKAYRAANREKRRLSYAAWRERNAERVRQSRRTYRILNADELRAKRMAAYRANPQKYLARSAEWRARNPEQSETAKLRAKLWREHHPERAAELARRWRQANPQQRRIQYHTRRARKNASGGKLSPGLALKLYRLQKGRCACCGAHLRSRFELDHIMPLALGGRNDDANIQLLLPECNNKKRARHPVDYMRSKGFLI